MYSQTSCTAHLMLTGQNLQSKWHAQWYPGASVGEQQHALSGSVYAYTLASKFDPCVERLKRQAEGVARVLQPVPYLCSFSNGLEL